MNEGYLFIIVSWIAVILITTHWLDPILGEQESLVPARRRAVMVVLLLLIFQGMYIPLTERVFINVGAILLLGVIFLYHFWKHPTEYSIQIISVILFLGVFYAVAYEIFFLDPILMVISPEYMLPAMLTLFVIFSVYELRLQLLVIVGGYLLGECMHKLFIFKQVQQVYIGDALFRDQLMMAVVMLFISNMAMSLFFKMYAYAKRLFTSLDKQEG